MNVLMSNDSEGAELIYDIMQEKVKNRRRRKRREREGRSVRGKGGRKRGSFGG